MGGIASIVLTSAFCGVASWLLGRRLVGWQSSSMLAETVQIHRLWLVVLGLFAVLVQPLILLAAGVLRPEQVGRVFFASPTVLAAAPIVALALLLGYFPARRQIFGDRWGAAGYVDHWLRVVFAVGGPWVVSLFAPYLTHAAGAGGWIIGWTVCAGLLAWLHYFVPFVRWMMRVDDALAGEVRQRMAEVVACSRMERVDVASMGPESGRWAGLISVWSDRPLVLVSRTLLQEADDAAVAALLAREVGRMERVPWWRGALALPGLVIVATLLEPVLALVDPAAAEFMRWAWPFAVLLSVVAFAFRQGRVEAALDSRAVQLLGGGEESVEALARGLQAVHSINLLPVSSSIQGPGLQMVGLEQRLAGLRDDAVGPVGDSSPDAVPAMAPTLFRDAEDRGRALLFDEDGVRIVEGAQSALDATEVAAPDIATICAAADAVQRFPFAGLMQLQFYPGRRGPEILVVQRSALAQRVRIGETDVPRAREALERVQERLGSAVGTVLAYTLSAMAIGLAGICAFVVSWTGVLTAGAVLTLLTSAIVFLVGRRRTWLAACSAMSVAMVAGPWLSSYDFSYFTAADWFCFFGVLLGGSIGLVMTVRSASCDAEGIPLLDSGGRTFAALCFLLCSLPLVVELALGPLATPLTRLLAIARESRGAWVTLAAAGAALAVHGGAVRRTLALLLVAACFAPSWLGSDRFAAAVGDPFAAGVSPTVVTEIERPIVADFELTQELSGLMLSPGGSWIGGFIEESDGHHHHGGDSGAHEHEFVVTNGTERSTFQALAMHFASDADVLMVRKRGQRLELQRSGVASPTQVLWSVGLPEALQAAHHIHIGEGGVAGWYVSGDSDGETVVAVVDDDGAVRSLNSWARDPDLQVHRIALPQDRVLELNWGEEQRGPPMSLQRVTWLLRPKYWLLQLRWLVAGGAAEGGQPKWSALSADCRAPGDGGLQPACMSYGQQGAWLWLIDADSGERTVVARLSGVDQWDWSGPLAAAAHRDHLYEIDASTGRVSATPLPRTADWHTAVVARRGRVALMWPTDQGRRVVVFGQVGLSS